MFSLDAALRYHAGQFPDRLAVVYEDQRISYADLEARIEAAAALLHARGVGRGQVVALLMKNSAAFIELSIAISRIGAVLLPVNYRLAVDEVRYILEHAGAALLLVDAELAHLAGSFAAVLTLDSAAQQDSRRLGGAALPPAPALEPPAQSDDLLRLMYTSGTTDRPKGVMHTYGNYYWKCFDHIIALALKPDDRLLVVGPLYHVGAFDLPGLGMLLVGGSLVVLREYQAEATLAAIERERISGVWMAPVMFGGLLTSPARDRHDLSSLRWMIGGGERTPEARIRQFSSLFPTGRYIDAYGLTESCSGDTMMRPGWELRKIGSVGPALAHVQIRICDDHGQALPAGSDGEICLRGPKITKGYWRDPQRTAAAFHGDWFRTGDVGQLDADGFLTLTDRKKDMIISGAENIASSEVERVLYALPQVAEAAVIGMPDERWGERVVAVVVLKPGTTLSKEQLDMHCKPLLAGFKSPRQLVIRETLPRNPSGKILKRVLREELMALS